MQLRPDIGLGINNTRQLFVRSLSRHGRQAACARRFRVSAYYERVLRYPNGVERRIRYPSEASETVSRDDSADGKWGDPYRSFSEEYQPDRWGPEEWDVSDLWAGFYDDKSSSSSTAAHSDVLEPQQQGSLSESANPLDILEQLTSVSFKEAQQTFWDRISGSYQVLDGCPWVVPKPLNVLALPQLAKPESAMFTLQTRVSRAQTESELSRVLGRKRADGSHLVSVSQMVEGVVCFEDAAAAEQFGLALEAEGHEGVSLAVCDSHSLFRLTTESQTVVVLVTAAGGQLPTPGQLEVSLRRQQHVD